MTKQPQSEQQQTRPRIVEVDSERAGQRIDNFLISLLKGVPKSHVYRIIRTGQVRVNKGRVRQSRKLAEGDQVRVPPIWSAQSNASQTQEVGGYMRGAYMRSAYMHSWQPEILFEDDALLVVNKPSGMAVHAGSGIKTGLIEALRAKRSDLRYLDLAHRLDRQTSGCLLVAKKVSVLRALHADFRHGGLDKSYAALVKGDWTHGKLRIDKSLDTEARSAGERHVRVANDAKISITKVKPTRTSTLASLVDIELVTGRTHQARVHLQSVGHPIALDPRYGDDQFNQKMRDMGLKRLFLHARLLRFTHPISEQKIDIEAPMPRELLDVLQQIPWKH